MSMMTMPAAARAAVGVALAAAIAARAVRRRSLDASGGAAGFLVTTVHIACARSLAAGLLLFTASRLTRVGQERKRLIEDGFKEGGQRNWIQVVANSTVSTILVVLFALETGGQDRCFDSKGGIIGHYCCCNGDTWSSEIGVLSDEQPLLITTLK
ncbi:LOW QUALITY PROTEIN: hypothetical protein U9M48_016558, partial [Paspalum notatum var. saurae]